MIFLVGAIGWNLGLVKHLQGNLKGNKHIVGVMYQINQSITRRNLNLPLVNIDVRATWHSHQKQGRPNIHRKPCGVPYSTHNPGSYLSR